MLKRLIQMTKRQNYILIDAYMKKNPPKGDWDGVWGDDFKINTAFIRIFMKQQPRELLEKAIQLNPELADAYFKLGVLQI